MRRRSPGNHTIIRRGRAEVVWPSEAPKGGQTASGPRPQPPTRPFAAPFPASRVAVTEVPSVSGRLCALPRSSWQPAANQRGSWLHVIWASCTPHLPSRAPVPERMDSRVWRGGRSGMGSGGRPRSQHPSSPSLSPARSLISSRQRVRLLHPPHATAGHRGRSWLRPVRDPRAAAHGKRPSA